MNRDFREAELDGWTQRAVGYDAHFTAITNQLSVPLERSLATVAGREILDVCCGPGHLTAALADRGGKLTGIDFAPPMIDLAMVYYPELSFEVGDAERLRFRSGAFDHVFCAYGVMHLSDPDRAIGEAFRVLRPGGKYVFSQWADDDELLAIVSKAITTHGIPAAGLPEAPPPMRFSYPDECVRTLHAAGFADCSVERIDVHWTGNEPEDVLRLVQEAATRAAMLIESQPPERRSAIEGSIVEAARSRVHGGKPVLKRPTLLAIGTRPA